MTEVKLSKEIYGVAHLEGTCKLAEGIDIKGKRVCVIEDEGEVI